MRLRDHERFFLLSSKLPNTVCSFMFVFVFYTIIDCAQLIASWIREGEGKNISVEGFMSFISSKFALILKVL